MLISGEEEPAPIKTLYSNSAKLTIITGINSFLFMSFLHLTGPSVKLFIPQRELTMEDKW